MYLERGIICMYRRSDVLSTITARPNTLTHQSTGTNYTPQGPRSLAPLQVPGYQKSDVDDLKIRRVLVFVNCTIEDYIIIVSSNVHKWFNLIYADYSVHNYIPELLK